MDFFLLVLKFAGIIIAGALGVLGTVLETHDEQTVRGKNGKAPARTVRRLNRWGRWALNLTIASLVVSLGAQVASEWKERGEGEAKQRDRDHQLRDMRSLLDGMAQQSLASQQSHGQLGRLVTAIENVGVDMRWELPYKHPAVSAFIGAISHGKLPADATFAHVYGHTIDYYFDLERLEPSSLSGEGERLLLTFMRAPRVQLCLNKSTPAHNALLALVRRTEPPPAPMPPAWALSVRDSGTLPPGCDVFLDQLEGQIRSVFMYNGNFERASIEWRGLRYPKTEWLASRAIVALTDLADVQLSFVVHHRDAGNRRAELDGVLAAAKPQWLDISFDRHKSSVTEFTSPAPGVYNAVLPSL